MSEHDTPDLPPIANFAGTAMLLAITMADSEPNERLEAALKKASDVLQNTCPFSQMLLTHMLTAIRDHGMGTFIPGEQPVLEDVLQQMHGAHQELRNMLDSGVVNAEDGKQFMEDVRQIALAAVFLRADSEPTQEQAEVLNYLYRVAQSDG